ncbi:MAG: hypothetical protein RI937_1295, partial [Pseudomonadota bacterium]
AQGGHPPCAGKDTLDRWLVCRRYFPITYAFLSVGPLRLRKRILTNDL